MRWRRIALTEVAEIALDGRQALLEPALLTDEIVELAPLPVQGVVKLVKRRFLFGDAAFEIDQAALVDRRLAHAWPLSLRAAASSMQTASTSAACSSSATDGIVGAIRMLRSRGSLR